jgi:hypothetical protein
VNELPTPSKPLYIQSFKTDDHISHLWRMIDALRRSVDSLAGRSVDGVNIYHQSITSAHVVPGADITAFHTAGDSFGATAVLGTNDAFDIQIKRNGNLVATFGAALLTMASGSAISLAAGTVSLPSLYLGSENTTGRYRIGADNTGESVSGALVFDWNSTRLRLNTGFSLDITDMTQGSILFAGSGAAGRVSQDNSNLFWDDTNNRLGINAAAAPAKRLEVRDTSDTGAIRITYTAASVYTDLYTNSSGNFNIAPTGNGTFSSGSKSSAFTLGTEQNGTGDSRLSAAQYGGTGDTYVILYAGGINWVSGIDRSDSDSFVWSDTTPGNSNKMRLTTGGFLSLPLSNTATTPGLNITQASTGDAALRFALSGATSYAIGIDNSVSGDPFVLAYQASAVAELGNTNILSIASGGHATWSRSDGVTTPTHDLIQAASGDSAIRFAIGSTASFIAGIDNSDSDSFKVSYAASGSAVLGTGDMVALTTGGLFGVNVVPASTSRVEFLDASNPQLRLTYTAGSAYTLFQTLSSGNFEISPTGGALDLKHSSSPTLGITGTGAGSANLNFTTNTILRWNNYVPSGSTDLRWNSGSTDYMTLDTSGNLYLSQLTTGSVLFVAASGKLTQDNTNLFWDDSNNTLEIGDPQTAAGGGGGVTSLRVDDAIEFDATTLGPNFDDTLHVGGIAMRSTTEAALDYGFVFRSPGGYIFEDVPGDVVTWRLIISSNGNSNFGMAASSTKSPASLLEVTGNFSVGSESWNGATAAPTNGAAIEGNVYIGTQSGSEKLHVFSTTTRVLIEGSGVTSAGWSIKTNGSARWTGYTPSGSADFRLSDGSDRVFLLNGGNFGLGISPTEILHIYATNPYLLIDSNGTGANGVKFQLNGTLRWTLGNPTTDAGLRFLDSSSNSILYLGQTGSETVFNDSQVDCDFRIEGDSISHLIFTDATATTENIALLAAAAPNWQSMDRGIFIGDTSAAPTGNPTGGGYLYVESGALKFRGSGGTITTVGPA